MYKTTLIFITLSFINYSQLILEGKIGPYPIELSIDQVDKDNANIKGKYRYSGKKTYLDLSGEIMGNCLFLEESSDGKITGSFYLQIEGNNMLGYWTNEVKGYEVNLKLRSEDMSFLKISGLEEKSILTSMEKSGYYAVEHYWVNDMWFAESNPNVEIGFNGGYVVIQEIDEDSIAFEVEVICGPTYHFAIASGTAIKMEEKYVYTNEDGCEITFVFTERLVKLEANNSNDCGFGARAYLGHDFLKTSDTIEFNSSNK